MADTLPYRIEHSWNRTSRAMLRDGTVLIRLARGLSAREEDRHIENLLRRMSKAASKEKHRTLIDPFRPLLEGAKRHTVILVTGTPIEFEITESTVKRAKADPGAHGWIVHRNPKSDTKTFHRFLWKLVSLSAAEEIETFVRQMNDATFREDVRSVKLKFMRSRWGSCSLGRNITLATPLLFTAPAILRYVIIHELAHILHHDHSEKFWNAVEGQEPSYRDALILLKQMTLPKV